MIYFGFFKGTKWNGNEDFESYKNIHNTIDKKDILAYLKQLPLSAASPMTVRDMFSGEMIKEAGIYEDGDFAFPTDFLHYYENYDIGIPLKYEAYLLTKPQFSKYIAKNKKTDFIHHLIDLGHDATFVYNSKKCGIFSKVENYKFSFNLCYGDQTKEYGDLELETVMSDPFFDGQSLNELLDILSIDYT